MTDLGASASRHSPVLALVERVTRLLDGIPYTLLALPLRAGTAVVFWNSAMAKLANWDTTIELFTEEYKVPLLPPEIAANRADDAGAAYARPVDAGYRARAARHDGSD